MPRNFELLWLPRLALPNARIIHCRRHPIDTCLSNYFADFWAQDYAWDRGDLVFFYRQYQRQMDHWRKLLPANRFIEVDYEALVADREAETRRLVAFVGLEWNDACLAPERNARLIKTASKWQARQPVYKTSVDRWRHYEPWLGELRELAPVAREGIALNRAGVAEGFPN
jgi:Sulfotransferase family